MKSYTQKEPLYRKVNNKARMSRHGDGGEYRHERHTKKQKVATQEEAGRSSMHSKFKHGLDYTPLYRFLLSKVGQDWTKIHSEALSRLDKEDPIFYMVARREDDRQDIVHVSENSYFHGLYVDDNNILQKVNAQAGPDKVKVWCKCCTFTLNGKAIPSPETLD